MFYLIGLGLNNEKSVSVEALEIIKNCKEIYLETYTAKLVDKKTLEEFYQKEIKEANRDLVESNIDNLLEKSKTKNIVLLIPGDVFSATTHISIYNRAKELNIEIKILNNASILTAIGITGLDLYKFGRITTIPFNNNNITSPIEIIKENLKSNLHSLILLDIGMTAKEGAEFLLANNIKDKLVACSKLGNEEQQIIYTNPKKIKDLGGMQCLILPAKKLHFIEIECLANYKN